MNYMTKYKEWLLNDYFDQAITNELKAIEDNQEEIEDRFYRELNFGTGGMRGIIGAGTNRMNRYMIRKATQGLANYIINYSDDGRARGVVIAHDSRHYSPEFALEAALVLNGNGIKAYLFDELRPTPELSFAVRELDAISGIVITASHNPPEYNGYKVYCEDGGQVVPEQAREIIAEIQVIDDFELIKRMEREEAERQGLLVMIGEQIDRRYIEEVLKVVPNKELARNKGENFPVIYTPLHGTGNKPVGMVLKQLGFKQLEVVPEQAEPDPDFSTVKSPNPEDIAAFKMALKMAEKSKPALIIATDPDCDRMGLMVSNKQGQYINLTGNQIGVLLTNYLLEQLRVKNSLPVNGVIIKTIVSTEMVCNIAGSYGIEVLDVLTGFKFIGEKIKDFEEKGGKEFIFGFEESNGYLAGTYARDKDAVVAAALVADMALYYQEREDKTIYQKWQELLERYGYYREILESIQLTGKKGQEKIEKTMNRLREERPEEICAQKVVVFKDYLTGRLIDYLNGQEREIDLPEANVLQFKLADQSLLTIRPSGTEPKLKIYCAVRGNTAERAEEKIEGLRTAILDEINQILEGC